MNGKHILILALFCAIGLDVVLGQEQKPLTTNRGPAIADLPSYVHDPLTKIYLDYDEEPGGHELMIRFRISPFTSYPLHPSLSHRIFRARSLAAVWI